MDRATHPAVMTPVQQRFMDRARKALTAPPPRLHPQSWDALRSLARLHGVEALLAALRHIEGDRT